MDATYLLGLAQDLGVLLVFAVVPWLDVPASNRLRADPTSARRLRLYRRGFIGQWVGCAYALALAGPARIWSVPRAPDEWAWLDHPIGMGVAIAFCLAFAAAALLPAARALQVGAAMRARHKRATEALAFVLPASPLERRWWAALSISAGVCEEFVYRGFLIQYFRGALEGPLHLGLTPAVLLATLAFGLGHAYQGVNGVVRTATVGAIFVLLAVLSGSLLLPIVLHALVDL